MSRADYDEELLGTLVATRRGLTAAETATFFETGVMPDLSQLPVEVEPVVERGFSIEEALAALGDTPILAAGGPSAPGELIFAFDPDQERGHDGRWVKIGAGRDLTRLSDSERSRLATLEKLNSAPGYTMSSGMRAELAQLQNRAGESRPQPRDMTPEETLSAAPVALQKTRRGGTELVCRETGVTLCDEDDAKDVWAAARDYRSISYQDINGLLRHGETVDTPASVVGNWVENLDRAMRASRLKEDVRVTRGLADISGLFPADAEDLTGWTWTERSYVSTTANPNVADEVFGESMIMNIVVPKGTGAIQLSESFNNDAWGEGELLLDRNVRMRVVADHGENSRGQRIVDVEVF